MKRKFIVTMLAIVLAVSSLFLMSCSDLGGTSSGASTSSSSSSNSGNGATEITFTPYVSTSQFADKDEALEGFLQEQIVSSTTTVVFVSYEKKADLTQAQIDALNLGEDAQGLVSVEEGTIVYKDEVANLDNQTDLYVLSYTDYVKYCTTGKYEEGDVLTKIDYDNITKNEAFSNSTVKGTFRLEQGQNVSASTIEIYCTGAALLYKEYGAENSDDYMEMFIVKDDNGYFWSFARFSRNGEYFDYSKRGEPYETMTEAFESALFSNQGNHAYLVRSSTGFKLDESKKQTYFNDFVEKYEYYGAILVEANCEFIFDNTQIAKLIHYNKGTLQGVEIKQEVEFNFSNYGTTVLEIPQTITNIVSCGHKHVDGDTNFVCDNCSSSLNDNDCFTKDGDTTCDICGEEVVCNSHNDDNFDDLCDVCGAEMPLEECEVHFDFNQDGLCDECSVDMSTVECTYHYDLDTDEVCDVCKVPFADIDCVNHYDLDGDELCDVCKLDLSSNKGCGAHVDLNEDGICDKCYEELKIDCEEHEDLTADDLCDNCGAFLSDGQESLPA